MLIFRKSNVTLSSWMWWSTLIFGGMELHGKRRSLFLTLIIILYSSTLHNGRVRSQDPVVIQRNYHWLHFLNWIMAYAFWTVFGNLFKACLGTVRYLCLRGGRWFSRNSGIWKIYPSPEVGNLKNYPPVYVTGPKCNPPTPTPLLSGRDVPPIAKLRTTRVLAGCR